MPLAFEDVEQAGGSIQFLSRGPGYVVGLHSNEAVLQIRTSGPSRPSAETPRPSRFRPDRQDGTSSTLRMRVVGGNSEATMYGAEPLATRTNYFIGNDPGQWRTNVPTFRTVRYYPGIDLVFYGHPGALEHDWVVRSDKDPCTIEIAFDGVEEIDG